MEIRKEMAKEEMKKNTTADKKMDFMEAERMRELNLLYGYSKYSDKKDKK